MMTVLFIYKVMKQITTVLMVDANNNDYRQHKVCILSFMSKAIDTIGIDYH